MIQSERLYLRGFLTSDSKDLFEYLSLPEVTKYEPYDPITLEESEEIARERSTNECFWAICLKENDKVIGNVYLSKINPDYINTYSIGFVLNPKYQNKGFATEATSAILNYVFIEKGAHRVVAYCNVKNARSWKLLERLKMRREGTMLENIYFKHDEAGKPIWNDSHMYAILRDHYLKNTL